MSARPVTIRKAGPNAAGTLLDLQQRCLPGDVPLPFELDHLAWIAWDGRTAVGFVLFKDGGTDIYILERAGVLSGWGGQGIYKRLLRAAERGMPHPSNLITYTANRNIASANGLLGAGWKLYDPQYRWGWADGLYFKRTLL